MKETLKQNTEYGSSLLTKESELKIGSRPLTSIREVILENFMSYEYARIPFTSGLNIVCGPNGSGKSSILLGISVALGQIYTERSRKLSDLIRRGKDIGRVTVMFDNKPVDGKRPIPFTKSDSFLLSRYLRKDGSYWFEADFREVTTVEVKEMLESLNINPNNMLLIMHQGMVEEFAMVQPNDKLRMVEEVVGLTGYREKVMGSQKRLQSLVSEETSIRQLLNMAQETLEHWKETYERYLKKQELVVQRESLTREKFWAQVSKLEKSIEISQNKLEVKKEDLNEISSDVSRAEEKSKLLERDLQASYNTLKKFFHSITFLESDRNASQARSTMLLETIESVRKVLQSAGGNVSEKEDLLNIRESLSSIIDSWDKKVEVEKGKSKEASSEIDVFEKSVASNEGEMFGLVKKYAEERANLSLLSYQKKQLAKEVAELEDSLNSLTKELDDYEVQKKSMEPRVNVNRSLHEIDSDLSSVNAQVEVFADVPNEAKNIFESYSSRYEELKVKLEQVSENKKAVFSELEERKKIWWEGMHKVLETVNPVCQEILKELNAFGYVRLIDEEDFEKTGLELLIGFRGTTPAVLDAYTLSGGEKSTSTIAFLLALQRLSPSPIVAVDEFDVHMDPVNREKIFESISKKAKTDKKQYVMITPSQVRFLGDNVNYIVTQMVEGKTEVGMIANK
jgi:chromosome segregation protein